MAKRRDSLLRKYPKIHSDIYEIRFKPPPVRLSQDEFLVSVLHTNRKEIRSLRKQLNGSPFYVKSVDCSPARVEGGHTILVKLKRFEPRSS
jgi:hypothetical protein